MYWKICIVGIFQVYKINFFFFFLKWTYTSAFESAGIGSTYSSVFKRTYASVFESAGIGLESVKFKRTYASAFKSASIGPFKKKKINFIDLKYTYNTYFPIHILYTHVMNHNSYFYK